MYMQITFIRKFLLPSFICDPFHVSSEKAAEVQYMKAVEIGLQYMLTPEQRTAALISDLLNVICSRDPDLLYILSCCCNSFHVAYLAYIVSEVT